MGIVLDQPNRMQDFFWAPCSPLSSLSINPLHATSSPPFSACSSKITPPRLHALAKKELAPATSPFSACMQINTAGHRVFTGTTARNLRGGINWETHRLARLALYRWKNKIWVRPYIDGRREYHYIHLD